MTVVDTDTRLVPTDEIPWAELAPGIEVKLLRVGGETGTYTVMARFAPGIELPRHRHFGAVHAYTVQGRWRYREYDWVADTGSFVYEPPGSVHTLEVPDDAEGPTVVMFVMEGGMVMLDEQDQPWMYEDPETMRQHYAGALAARGIPYPHQVLS
ncbi:MAG: 2,4'-dihydroxyacetophenone dioxygenase family protein [Acidimicrobiia bacterium]|nr:2,4'-dihydroxyacetophenone dioxygenase family protein [Acidimicrobiia bacterium]